MISGAAIVALSVDYSHKTLFRVDPSKVEAIINIPVPKNQKEVRQFCGTASWYRRFIPDFAARLYPLTNLLKKRQKFEWTEETQKAFEDIQSCLIKAPILACPDFSKPFTVSCDASAVGIGCVLSQQISDGQIGKSGGENVIAYASRTLSRTEQKFSATERECLAVIWAVERFRPYIEGTHFTIVTDHYSLLWLHNLKDPQGRLARWALRLQPYDYTLVHRKGKEHVVPDLLSRALPKEGDTNETDLNNCQEVNVDVIDGNEKTDKWYENMVRKVEEKREDYPNWKVDNGVLLKHTVNRNKGLLIENEEIWKRVVPKNQRAELLQRYHDDPTAGHQGTNRTYDRIHRKYYWPKMKQDISRYIKRCKICQTTKFDQEKSAGLMGMKRGVNKPWKMISADVMGPFPRSSSGYKYLLVVLDTFTKLPLLFPLRAASANIVARHLENDVFMMFGVPTYICVDNGPEFTGKKFKDLAQGYNVKILYNASRHAQANPTERVNRTLGPMLRAYVGENHRDWDRNISKIGFALRTAKSESTGYSPAFLNFGRELDAQNEVLDPLNTQCEIPEIEDSTVYGNKLKELRKIYQTVTEKLKSSFDKNAQRYNLRRRPKEFNEGDQVWKRNFPISNAANFYAAKLAPRYTGPFVISKKVSSTVYHLEDSHGKSAGNWHVSDLKQFNSGEKI